ncbi:MAG: 2-iminoacetate synthase ThiH [Opitutales bacterium]
MSTFSKEFDAAHIEALVAASQNASGDAVEAILREGRARSLEAVAALLSPAAGQRIETLARLSQATTQRHFGKAIRLFAPLYLSNECINICKYCGFSRNNPIPRITIPREQVEAQTQKLASRGFRHLLIVAGEHPKYVSNGYVEDCVRRCLAYMPSIAIELGPMETQEYIPLVRAGAESLILYQETYHEATYRAMHTAGPKKHYHWRMDTPERAYAAGFRRLGIGALLGLHDWRFEVLSVAMHSHYLLRHCWKAQVAVSLPRLRPAAGGFSPDPRHVAGDLQLLQTICALRLFLPHLGITLSTRESPQLRDGLTTLGVTLMSAGSSTEPGGYDHFDEAAWTPTREQPGEQFHIADERPPQAIAQMIRDKGYEPVWKDHDQVLASDSVNLETA